VIEFKTEIEQIQETFLKREVKIHRPESEFPELIVRVPDSWKTIQLAPLYDVHIGSGEHDAETFGRHLKWLTDTPDVLSFNGGDLFENANKYSPGASVIAQKKSPEEQILDSTRIVAPIQHKLLFSLPGNHEDRTMNGAGMDSAARLATDLKLPYFPDYCFCTIKWRGQNFRILAHHGTGAAQTPGAQRNAARKDLPWTKFDIYWTGHLHQPMADVVYQTDFNQETGRVVERSAIVMISPSYLKYFGGYAAKKRFAPGIRGLGVVTLNEDGRMDVSLHARGERL